MVTLVSVLVLSVIAHNQDNVAHKKQPAMEGGMNQESVSGYEYLWLLLPEGAVKESPMYAADRRDEDISSLIKWCPGLHLLLHDVVQPTPWWPVWLALMALSFGLYTISSDRLLFSTHINTGFHSVVLPQKVIPGCCYTLCNPPHRGLDHTCNQLWYQAF
jgi:hypothetical protein